MLPLLAAQAPVYNTYQNLIAWQATLLPKPGACAFLGNPFSAADEYYLLTCLSQQLMEITERVTIDGSIAFRNVLSTPLIAISTLAIIIIAYNMLLGNEQSLLKPIKNIILIAFFFVIFNSWATTLMPATKTLLFGVSAEIGEAINPWTPAQINSVKSRMTAPANLANMTVAPPLIDLAFTRGLQMSMAVFLSAFKIESQYLKELIGNPASIGLTNCAPCPTRTVVKCYGMVGAQCVNITVTDCPDKIQNRSKGFFLTLLNSMYDSAKNLLQILLMVFLAFIILYTASKWAISAALMFLTNYLRGALLLLLGPLFFIFALFKKTRDIAEKWFQNLISIFMLNLILVAMIILFVVILDNTLTFIQPPGQCEISPFMSTLLTAVLFMLLSSMTSNLPTIVQELTGSAGQSGADVIGSAMKFGAYSTGAGAMALQAAKTGFNFFKTKGPGMVNKVGPGGKMNMP